MAAITVEDLTKSYGAVKALRGVSFEVARGEIFALLGPNGAGKTSIIEILEGYRRRDGGKLQVLGFDPGEAKSRFKELIGIVLQSTAFEPELTVEETVRAFARLYRKPLRMKDVIEVVGLSHLGRRRVRMLSGGEQRRLDIALAIIGDPDILFLDEPTTGLDPQARRRIWDLISGLNSRGKTVLLSSHHMDEVERLAHRLAILSEGRILTEGEPGALQLSLSDHAIVRFHTGAPDLPEHFPPTLRPLFAIDRGWAEMRVRDPGPVVADLTHWAFRHRIELTSLTITRPSLEDLYLRLTARPPEERP